MFLSKMKLFGATVNFVAVSQASRQIMVQHFTELFDDALLLAGVTNSHLPTVPIIESIDGYGCWCYRRNVNFMVF